MLKDKDLKHSMSLNKSEIELKERSEIFSIEDKEKRINSHLVRIELERDKKVLRRDKLKYMLIAYVGLLLVTFMKGSEYFSSIIGVKV